MDIRKKRFLIRLKDIIVSEKYTASSYKDVVRCFCFQSRYRLKKDNVFVFNLNFLINFAKKYCFYIDTKTNLPPQTITLSKKREKNEIYHDFFNLEKQCPEEIKDCENLRVIYKTKLENTKLTKTCTGCSTSFLQLYFIKHYLENKLR